MSKSNRNKELNYKLANRRTEKEKKKYKIENLQAQEMEKAIREYKNSYFENSVKYDTIN